LPISPPRYLPRQQRVRNEPIWESPTDSERKGAALVSKVADRRLELRSEPGCASTS
jgi:hypothetical protein